MQRQVIYISSFPKSGSTWLTRLLGDILNSPTGGCMPEEDAKEVATEGQDRLGPYVVRKGHFVLVDSDTGPVVPSPHRLAWRQLTNEKIVFLVRDPRDICISGAYHWRQSPAEFLDRMIKGDVAKCGRWDEYCDKWLDLLNELIKDHRQLSYFEYERLLSETTKYYLPVKVERIGVYISPQEAVNSLERQSFTTRKAQIGDDEKELRRNNMRKGIVGDWRNHFTPEMNDKIWSEFGWIMERLGYDKAF